MVTEFVIENQTTNDVCTFGQTVDKNYLFKDGDIDWGVAEAEHSKYSYPGQVGTYISMTNLRERNVSIAGYVYFIVSKEERNRMGLQESHEYAYEKIKEKKKFLNALVNPNHFLKVIVGDYYLLGKPTQSIKYGTTFQENNEYFCRFYIDILCNNPMFFKITETKTVISSNVPMFMFPLAIPRIKGFYFGVRQNYLMLAIDNEGDTEIGGKIILKALDEIVNPTIENVISGEKITIDKTMQKGDKIIINTNKGSEQGVVGIVNGFEENFFKYWNFGNDWIKFQKGITLLGYYTDNGNENFLDVSVELNPQKLGLEEM